MSGAAKGRGGARRAAPATKPAPARKPKKPAGLSPTARRWAFIAGFTLALLVGLPLAHAMLGDIGAVLLGTFAFGFVVGRMTLRR